MHVELLGSLENLDDLHPLLVEVLVTDAASRVLGAVDDVLGARVAEAVPERKIQSRQGTRRRLDAFLGQGRPGKGWATGVVSQEMPLAPASLAGGDDRLCASFEGLGALVADELDSVVHLRLPGAEIGSKETLSLQASKRGPRVQKGCCSTFVRDWASDKYASASGMGVAAGNGRKEAGTS